MANVAEVSRRETGGVSEMGGVRSVVLNSFCATILDGMTYKELIAQRNKDGPGAFFDGGRYSA